MTAAMLGMNAKSLLQLFERRLGLLWRRCDGVNRIGRHVILLCDL